MQAPAFRVPKREKLEPKPVSLRPVLRFASAQSKLLQGKLVKRHACSKPAAQGCAGRRGGGRAPDLEEGELHGGARVVDGVVAARLDLALQELLRQLAQRRPVGRALGEQEHTFILSCNNAVEWGAQCQYL